MYGTFFCVATMVLGVEIGWGPDTDGRQQYIIQVEPELAQRMCEGKAIEFSLRPEHVGCRHFRIQVGAGQPPRVGTFATPKPPVEEKTPARQTAPTETSDRNATPGLDPIWGNSSPAASEATDPEKSETDVTTEAKGSPSKEQNKGDKKKALVPPWGGFSDIGTGASPTKTVPPETPNPLPPNPAAKEIAERPASHEEPVKVSKPDPEPAPESETPAPNSLKTPLILTSCLAAALFAAFCYLAWIHLDARRRYRQLLNDYYAAVGKLPGTEGEELALGM
jgi:hypothetical protein